MSGWLAEPVPDMLSLRAFSSCQALPASEASKCLQCAGQAKVPPAYGMLAAEKENGTRAETCARCFATADAGR